MKCSRVEIMPNPIWTLSSLRAALTWRPCCTTRLWRPLPNIERLKTRVGRLDFLDLLIKARNLIRDNATVRNELQRRHTHFFIDEFQDTDPLQVEILLLLSADDPAVTDWRDARPAPGKLFVVGDPKQSIYRFRRADIALYEEVKARLIRAGAELRHLTTSFRAAFDSVFRQRRVLARDDSKPRPRPSRLRHPRKITP